MVSKDSGKKDIAVEKEFYEWLLKKKQWNESRLEDCLRRLTRFKPRKPLPTKETLRNLKSLKKKMQRKLK